jgi:outer membrane receptor for ferrienterochelin and colicins
MPERRSRAWWGLLGASLIASCLSLSYERARADGVADEAEVNFRLGAERYQAGDYRPALAFFLASQRLAPNRNVRFNIVRTFQRLGMNSEAYRWCEEALAEETDPALRAELSQLLSLIERDVAVVEVSSEPVGATIYIDRVELGSLAKTPARLALSEGEHRVILELAGHERVVLPSFRAEKHKVVPVHARLSRVVGELVLPSAEPSEVRVDDEAGEPQCTTPCRLELAPGSHVIYFRRAGFRIAPRQVRIVAGKRSELSVEAVPLTGALVVTSDVRDALVEVDGKPLGFTPAVLGNVPVGTRKLRVTLAGHEPIEREVEVREGAPTDVGQLSLVPSRKVTAASRVDQSVDEAPASVSVISGYEIEAFRYPTIAEALRGQRGVAIQSDGVYTGLSVRGLGQPGDYGNRVLVLADGATLNDNIVWQSYVGYDGRADLGDLARIELVRGPGSVLYGTGALTGLVNLVSKPLPERATGEVRVSAHDARTARGRASYAMPFSARSGFALSVSGAHSDGRSVRLDTDPPTDVDHVERFNAATSQLRAQWKDLAVLGFFTYREQDIPAGAYGAVIGDPRNWVRDTRGLVELRYEPELVKKRIRLYTRGFANLYRFDSEQAFAAEPSVSLVRERFRGLWFGAEARLVGTFTKGLRLTLGSEIQASTQASLHGDNVSADDDDGQGMSTTTLSESLPYQTYAGYGVLDWKVNEVVTASAGARIDAWSTFGATVNPRFNIVLRPHAAHVVKLVAGRAFRAPSIYELRYGDGTTQLPSNYAGNKLGPELTWSGEVEYTYRFLEHWAFVSAAHFQFADRFIEQTLTNPNDESSPIYYRNTPDEALTVGGDLELRRELFRGLLISASYGYLYSRYIGEKPAGSSRLPNAPAHYASLRAIIPMWAGTKLALRNTLESPRRISTLSQASTGTAVITDLVLSAAIADTGFDFACGVYNLFDFRLPLPTDPTFVTRTLPQPGRTLMVSLGLRMP